jgi:hypothetical protein
VPAALKARVGAVLAAVLVVGCATGGADVVAPSLPASVADYLMSPTRGASSLSPSARAEIDDAFARLLRGDSGAARATSARLLADDELPAARVLAAQALFVEGDPAAARAQLQSLASQPTSSASARLLWARLAELGGEMVAAQVAYRSLGGQPAVAGRGARTTYEPAVRALVERISMGVEAGAFEGAHESLDLLRQWEPSNSQRVLESTVELARAEGDLAGELEGLRGLLADGRAESGFLLRRAELEMQVGDADAGLQAFEDLQASYPEDIRIASARAEAQVRWRLRLLPIDVQRVAAESELTRADFAVLLYWLVPGVRQSAGGNTRIATDVLDDERRDEIVRVLNRGLMEVDETLHRFGPRRTLTRGEALRSALAVAAAAGDECGASERGSVCRAAQACGLIDEGDECRAQEPARGSEAVAILGRAMAGHDGE